MTLPSLNKYLRYFHEQIPLFRQNKYVQILVLRETKSYAIFTTEGDALDTEQLQAGYTDTNAKKTIDRVVMFKRKQIAPERRTGKALLRQFGLVGDGNGEPKSSPKACYLMEGMCGECPDCVLYGFAAVQGESSQKSRLLTDSAFTLRSYTQIQKMIKLNAIQDKTEGGVAGSAFAERDTLIPQVFLPCVETLVDVTPDEFVYVLGNILQTTRYGAEANREGYIRNHVVGISFGNVEKLSNLDLTQRLYDKLAGEGQLADALHLSQFINADGTDGVILEVFEELLSALPGHSLAMPNPELKALLNEVYSIYNELDNSQDFLTRLDTAARSYANTKNGRSRN
ncbi:MAG TPA: type I-D CRISPR-associated protein Cas7/Csc2 [Cyanobacteria bacterium UBA8803]|nr:type I-D CRISPR-associated protein Cas7/Csc2 [Cyanobacteria bacterium UBA9273]HBL58582.1 type I-D CRISPR-associated protein Cas7/Csc2 [Cyanobacteria bacterium UBA8803]